MPRWFHFPLCWLCTWDRDSVEVLLVQNPLPNSSLLTSGSTGRMHRAFSSRAPFPHCPDGWESVERQTVEEAEMLPVDLAPLLDSHLASPVPRMPRLLTRTSHATQEWGRGCFLLNMVLGPPTMICEANMSSLWSLHQDPTSLHVDPHCRNPTTS